MSDSVSLFVHPLTRFSATTAKLVVVMVVCICVCVTASCLYAIRNSHKLSHVYKKHVVIEAILHRNIWGNALANRGGERRVWLDIGSGGPSPANLGVWGVS